MIAGSIQGAITASLDQAFFINILIGLALHLLFGLALLFLTGGGWIKAMTTAYYASVIIGTINGAIISTVNLWYQALK